MLTTLLILLPIAGALVVWLFPLGKEAVGGLALLVALGEVGVWILALLDFDFDSPAPQHAADREWFSDLGVSYQVGMYGFSLWLIGLTVVVCAAAVGYAAWVGKERARAYFGLLLFLTGSIVGVFASQDLLLFYVFFEAMLIPLYILIGVWGGEQRVRATFTFVVYTMAGSLLMLASVVAFGIGQGTFSLTDSGTSDNEWIFLGFLVAFAVKAPLLPLHGWLRLAYTQAPPEIAAVLSGVVSKAAVFGFVWIMLPRFPEPVADFREVVLVIAAAGVLYGSILAFRQPDVRSVVAYSSMAQMGLITFGVFATNTIGLDGAILQSVAHGLVSAVMFLLAGMLIRRCGTDTFSELGGMAKGRPILATVVMVTGMLMLAVPGSVGFAGEFLILTGVFDIGWGYSVVGAVAIVLAAMYTLRVISAILHGRRGTAVRDEALDLRPVELGLILPLLAILLALSVWPAAVSERSFPDDDALATMGEASR